MSITIEELDSLEFEIVKQKYYNANKVNAKLDELKAGVRELIEENQSLKNSIAESEKLAAASDAMINSAQQVADAKISEAEAKADEIIRAAQEKAQGIITGAALQSGSPAGVGLTEAQLDLIDELNRKLDSLNTSQSTQIFKIKQQLMNIVIG
ncbi:MAG: hypothetical protein Q4A83_09210 [Bacillota bacterium]|nr:hypothetical protein [Bacillota bacterium]